MNGFKKLLRRDSYSFEELASIHDNGDDVNFYLRSIGKKNRYMILIQDADEIIAIEMKGHIDVNLLF